VPRHAPRTSRIATALLVALALVACRRASGPPPERFVRASAAGWVVVPELRRAVRELAALHETVSRFPGAAQQLAGVRAALAAQLGFDVLDLDALARAGIEPARGAALTSEPDPDGGRGTPVVILPFRDASGLERLVGRLARERLGAPGRTESAQGELRVVTFRLAGGAPARSLARLPRERTAALAPGPSGPAAVAAALSRARADSLADSGAYRELRKVLGERYAVLAGGSAPAAPGAILGREGLAVGVSAGAGLVRLGLASRLGTAADAARALRAGGDSRALVRSLSPDAALVLRWDGDFSELGKRLVARMEPQDRAWLSRHGFDPRRDLFDLLAPGAAASLSISPRLDLSDLSDTTLRADPLRVVRFELIGDVKDQAAARESLARLPALFTALQEAGGLKPPGAAAVSTGDSGRILAPSGEIAWRLTGKRLALAGGPAGALDALLARQGGSAGYAAPTRIAAAALQGGLGGAVLSPRNLVASVRALPEDSFGTGPTGFVVRSVVERFLEPADRVAAVSLRADLGETALTLDLELEAPAPDKEAR
jgi:hypothetical protein